MKLRHAVAALFVLHLVVGASPADAQGRRRSNVITQEEIEKAAAQNAYELIRELRPAWFRARGVTSTRDVFAGGLAFFVDGIQATSMDALESLGAERIKEARYVNAADATTKYGTGYTAGVVEITTKR